jgi:hypothetical protein
VPPDIHADDNGLAAKTMRRIRDQRGRPHGGGVDRDLVGAQRKALMHVREASEPAAPRQRHETGPAHRFEDGRWIG